ncbi:MAG: hypothetical protein A2600_05325 [Candidatus Lambdaproteobacteria bacterium RIFOXYD1_FULL_56_27]|uniref:Alpha-D-phosphohexomutase alpha/beta/alpha domain-containing protein n=1 Tax=Candidatus Lambdaproteobacteria bacterium RIFOXYD2_FULL_56_26 TaxID=1817773 RepID=A0A1F6GRY7_9PROT|nr:MAG: hypothetical protein A2426_08180 [Candidatus Lambdaproteobacteria bacterium RIFOXYC1_FULL_56_13]OGH00761.1 MAG: hypothetical protein A2557_03560 [Candidatus Lambdaproteobacteria bacterium RIFOXYD2_FULL_56_26]OGH09974.1 MAG: hypothetical protein A2600_05325 [Candidatus Lambdaproteobacteria bacterium RIFOXYD1_FULL_56_27]
MTNLLRLQGTDGVRGRVKAELGSKDPVATFVEEGFLTPAFFELYGYAFGQLLLETRLARQGDKVAVGWDGRDEAGRFDSAFVQGLRKAGLTVLGLGILPTPAVPLYMMEKGCRAGAMLTASHNPADQNGIKLFLPGFGLKFLPQDDQRLTTKLYAYKDLDFSRIEPQGEMIGVHEEAWAFFVESSLDPKNSWITAGMDLKDHLLVIDASKGAAASVVEPLLGGLGLRELILTNLEGPINQNCGVTDLEGQESITQNDLARRYPANRFLAEFFAQTGRSEIWDGSVRLVGLAFDGDGDRCYRLDYDPKSQKAWVSSGDLLGFHLGQYLAQTQGAGGRSFAFTVESDLLLGQAVKALGFQETLTGVGDKWLLVRAVASVLRSRLALGTKNQELWDYLEAWQQNPAASALDLTVRFEAALAQGPQTPSGPLDFALGLEESGHALSPFWLHRPFPGFAGNGLKAGLNSLAAMAKVKDGQTLAHPFAGGMKETFYVYYVDKSRLEPGQAFRETLSAQILSLLPSCLGEGFTGQFQAFGEEPSLLFCHLSENGTPYGAVFVRNSGTEDKSALYLRGPLSGTQKLGQLAQALHLLLLRGLKNSANPLAQLEARLLAAIAQGQDPKSLPASGLPVERVLKEMEAKQGLIERSQDGFVIAQKGKALLKGSDPKL